MKAPKDLVKSWIDQLNNAPVVPSRMEMNALQERVQELEERLSTVQRWHAEELAAHAVTRSLLPVDVQAFDTDEKIFGPQS